MLDEPSITASNILDPLRELFAPVSQASNGDEKELQSVFSSSNVASAGAVMTTEKIMALFNTPLMMAPSPHREYRIAKIESNDCVVSSPVSAYPPTHLLPHQKSMPFTDHLCQSVHVCLPPAHCSNESDLFSKNLHFLLDRQCLTNK